MSQGRTFSTRGWLVVWLLPVLLIAGLVAAMVAGRPPAAPGASGSQTSPTDGGDGVGDPYFPSAGGGGYDAEHYAIDLVWDEAAGVLSGTTTLTARATRELTTFHVDLAYRGATAEVGGVSAVVKDGPGTDVAITPARPIQAGETFTARLSYAGDPERLGLSPEQPAVFRTGTELVVAGEPEGAAAWFASNDHPSDPATFDLRVRVPSGREVLSTGRLVSRDEDVDPATATWHWTTERPAATYLTFLALGEFEVVEGVDEGRPYVYAVSELLAPDARARALAQLRTTGAVVRELESRYGPYPYGELGGVVVGVRTWFGGLECATRPVYDSSLAAYGGWPRELLVHEQSHMWFGNHTAVARWRDVVNNEGWATFVQQDDARRRWGESPREGMLRDWDRLGPGEWEMSIADPGIDNMFGTTYSRGGLALHALRNVLGDQMFFAIAREWAQLGGARTLTDFQQLVEQRSGRDLRDFWHAWYDAPRAPPRTVAYGYPG